MAQMIDKQTAMEFLQLLFQRPLTPTTPMLISAAIEIQQRYRISYWDAAIVAAAEAISAKVLYTEDLSHGQFYGSVQVLNPFRVGSPAPATG